jgi:hypothetical protein
MVLSYTDDEDSALQDENQSSLQNRMCSQLIFDGELSAEEQRAKQRRNHSSLQTAKPIVEVKPDTFSLQMFQEFNYFQYWREPIACVGESIEEPTKIKERTNTLVEEKISGNGMPVRGMAWNTDSPMARNKAVKDESRIHQNSPRDEKIYSSSSNRNSKGESQISDFNSFQYWREPISIIEIEKQDSFSDYKKLGVRSKDVVNSKNFGRLNTMLLSALDEQATMNDVCSNLLEETKNIFSKSDKKY